MSSKPWSNLRNVLRKKLGIKSLEPSTSGSPTYSPPQDTTLRPWQVLPVKNMGESVGPPPDYTLRRVANGWIITNAHGEIYVTEGKLDDALNRIKGEEIRREQDMEQKRAEMEQQRMRVNIPRSLHPPGMWPDSLMGASGGGSGGGGTAGVAAPPKSTAQSLREIEQLYKRYITEK